MPFEENITELHSISDIPQEVASSNIVGAEEMGIDHDAYADTSDAFKAEAKLGRLPSEAPKALSDKMRTSKQMSSLIRPDLEKLSSVERQWRFIKDSIKGTDVNRTLNNLNFKLATGGTLTEDEELERFFANEQKGKLVTAGDLDYNWIESAPGDVAGVTAGFIEGLGEGKWITAGGAFVGGALFGGLGFLAGGPAGALLGVKQGVISGASLATTFGSIPLDTWKQSVGDIYGELGETSIGKDTSNKALLARRHLALGGGALVTIANFAIVGKLATKIPFLKKAISPKLMAKELNKAVNSKWVQLALDMGQSAALEGSEESLQEFIQIVATNMGDWDGQETSFFNGMKKSLTEWDTLKRVGKAGFVGGLTGAGFVAAGQPLGKAAEKIDTAATKLLLKTGDLVKPEVEPDLVTTQEYNPEVPSNLVGQAKNLSPDEQGIRALKLADVFEQTAINLRETQISEALPDHRDQVVQEMMEDAGVRSVYIERDEIKNWADTEEKVADIETLIGLDQKQESDLNAPIKIKSGAALRLAIKYPKDFSKFLKLEPESPTAEQYINRVKNKKDTDAPVVQEDAFGEEQMLVQRTFEEDEDNIELQNARLKVTEVINDDPTTHSIVPLQERQLEIETKQKRDDFIESVENIQVVEDYLNNARIIGPMTPEQQKRFDKGLPVYTINPESLPLEVRAKYVDDPILKKRKVLSKDGMDAESLSVLFGFKDVSTFLDVMSSTPTKAQYSKNVEAKLKASEPKVSEAKIIKAYNGLVATHLKEMSKIFKKNEETVEYSIPTASKLRGQARRITDNTQVGDVNPNQWVVGERRSQTNAQIALKEGRIIDALEQKQKAALNSELAKQAHAVISRINTAIGNIAKMSSPEVRAALKEGGAVYVNAINSLMSLFNFGSVEGAEVKIDAYNKFVNKMRNEGRGDFRILNDILKGMTGKRSIDEMTVQQLLFVDKLMRRIVKEASLDNTVLSGVLGIENTPVDLIADEARDIATKHKDFDIDKISTPVGDLTWYQHMSKGLGRISALLTNMQFVTLRLDGGLYNGFFAKQIYQRMMGTGEHQGEYGYTSKVKLQGEMFKRFRDHVRKYDEGSKLSSAFRALGVAKVQVPEFAQIEGLNKGKLTKLDLLMLLANMGNIENRTAIENFGISAEKVMVVLQRELSVKEFDFVQEAMWDMFAELKPKIDELELATTGQELDFVEAEPFEAFGKTYEGGYLPLRYRRDTETEALIREHELLKDLSNPEKTGSLFPSDAYSGIVRSPHTKERVGSAWELNLEIDSFSQSLEDIIHDLTMRVPTRATMTILSNKKMAEAIKSVVGIYEYNVLVNTVAEQTNSVGSRNTRLYSGTQKFLRAAMSNILSSFTATYVAWNPSSIVVSTLAIPQIINQMGGKDSGKYLSLAALELYNPTSHFKPDEDVWGLVREIDPSLNNYRLGLDDHNSSSIANQLPKKRLFTSKTYNYLKTMQERSNEVALGRMLGGIDAQFKSVVARAAYLQYRAGDAKGVSIEQINAMSPEDIHNNAKAYAEQLSATATMRAEQLSRAPIQKLPGGAVISQFWNESRGVMSSRREDIRGFSRSGQKMIDSLRADDVAGANLAMYGAAGDIGRIIMTTMTALVIMNLARGRNMFEEDDDIPDELPLVEDVRRAPEWILSKVTTLDGAAEMLKTGIFGHMLIVRDMIFGVETGRGATVPIVKIVQDIQKTAFETLPYFFENLANDLTLIEAVEGLRDDETRALLNTISYTAGGFSVSGPVKVKKWLEGILEGDESVKNKMSVTDIIKVIDGFLNKFDEEKQTPEEVLAKFLEREKTGQLDTLQQTVKEIKQLRNQLVPTKDETLTDEDYNIIKYAESGGNWRATPDTSSAFGIYQFTKDTWLKVMTTPEGVKAGLTVRGRVQRDGKQQEKAMRILTSLNAIELRKQNIPVNIETIYFAHHFGPKYAGQVYKGSAKKRISKILTPTVLKANPRLVTDNVKTAGDMRLYIKEALNRGRRGISDDKPKIVLR